MPIHFTPAELERRRRRAGRDMKARGLDGLLMFRQESMYYLTGYDTFGYCFFQCLYLGTDGTLTLLTRRPDVLVARQTSIIEDIREWTNLPDADPTKELRDILDEHGARGARLGIELDAYGLTGHIHAQLTATLHAFCRLEDASDLVTRLRVRKSSAELKYVRRAAELADAALVEANRLAVPGAFEGDILAAMQGAVFRGDGDYSGNEFIIGSGRRALLGRYFAGRGTLGNNDQLTIEWAGSYRRYHSAMMRTILTGRPKKRHLDMYKYCVEAHHASAEVLKPGNAVGEVFDAYARVLDDAGYRNARFSATGYSMGTTYPPSWMDWPMFYHGNPAIIEPGMVFFIHSVAMDERRGLAMAPGQSYVVTKSGAESLSKMPLELVVN